MMKRRTHLLLPITHLLRTSIYLYFLTVSACAEYWRYSGAFTSTRSFGLVTNTSTGSLVGGGDGEFASYLFPVSFHGCHSVWLKPSPSSNDSWWGVLADATGATVGWKAPAPGWSRPHLDLYFSADVANITIYWMTPASELLEIYFGPCSVHPEGTRTLVN